MFWMCPETSIIQTGRSYAITPFSMKRAHAHLTRLCINGASNKEAYTWWHKIGGLEKTVAAFSLAAWCLYSANLPRPKTFGLTCKILNSKSRDFSQADRFFIRASSLVFWSNSVLFFLKKKISTQFTEKKRLYDKSGAKSNRAEHDGSV